MNIYQVLGVAETATAEQIKLAYKRLTFDNHPDRNKGDKAKEARFKEVVAAYEILGDQEKRRRYDAEQEKARAAELWAAWATPPRQRPPAPPPAPPPPSSKESSGGLLGGFLKILGIAFAGGAIAYAIDESGSYWDSSVGRRRGSDGRFRRS